MCCFLLLLLRDFHVLHHEKNRNLQTLSAAILNVTSSFQHHETEQVDICSTLVLAVHAVTVVGSPTVEGQGKSKQASEKTNHCCAVGHAGSLCCESVVVLLMSH